MKSLLSTTSRYAVAVAVLAALPITGAIAQEERQGVERIVVTAQKREQQAQDIPVAVSAYNAELLNNSGVRDIKDLAIIAPGLNVTSTSNEFVTTARIRGVGTVGDNPGLESSVGVVIDGVPRARNGTGFNDLGEIERIEVLRGPQGTVFGKNTSAGIINVVTKRPEYEFGGVVEGQYLFGDYEGYGISGSVTGPLIEDKVAARVYGATRNRDGFLDVNNQGVPALDFRQEDEDGNQDFYTVRGQLLFEPTSNISILLQGDITDRDEDCCLGVSLESGPTAGIVNALVPGGRPLPGQDDPFSRNAQANRPNEQLIDDRGLQGQLDWDLGWSTFTLIGSTRDYELQAGQDTDFTGADIVYRDIDLNTFDFKNDTWEARFAGATDRLEWLVGGFYSQEDLVRRDAIQFGAQFSPYLSLLGGTGDPTFATTLANGFGGAFIPGFGTPASPLPLASFPADGGASEGDRYEQQAESYSLFTNNTFSITDALDLTVGARWTHEEKTATFDFGDSVNPACDIYEAVLGNALDFTTPTNQAIIAGFAAAAGTTPAAIQQFVTFSCLPFSRDVFQTIDNTQTREEDELTGKLALSYRVNEDFLTYVSYSRGYKAGGFNLDRFDQAGASLVDFNSVIADPTTYPAQFEPETVDAYELGFKTEWLQNQLLANLILFYSDFETYQLNTFNGIAFFVTSVPGAESKGAELELLYLPDAIEGLSLQGGLTYADTTYNEFPATGTPDVDRLSGATFSLSPEWYLTGSASYRRPIATNLEWLAHVDGRWVSEQNTGSDLDPQKFQDGYAVFNARLGIGAENEAWAVELWSRNLLDEDYVQVGFDGPFQPGSFNAFLGQPRTYGVTGRVKF